MSAIAKTFGRCFFRYTWSDQNSSTKSSTKFWEDAKSYLLAIGTESKGFLLFPRNIQNRARLNTFSVFFGIVRLFFETIFVSPKSPPLMICNRMDENSQSVGAPIWSNFWVFGYCRREYLTLWSRFAFLSLLGWRRLGLSLVPACLFWVVNQVFRN